MKKYLKMHSVVRSITSIAFVAVMAVFVAFVPEGAIACAPAANASSVSSPFAALKDLSLVEGKHVVLFGTNEQYQQDTSAAALQLIQYKVAQYAAQTNQKLPTHEEEVLDGHGKVVIKSLVDASSSSCKSVKKFFRQMKPSFPNITFVGVLCQDGRIDVI